MRPVFKYSGGKTKEIKLIKHYYPIECSKIIEPFAGGAATSFYFNKENSILSDTRINVINCYKQLSNITSFNIILNQLELYKAFTIEQLEKEYYRLRDDLYETNDNICQAIRWIFIRQTTFSGMDRINENTGKINSPFGWYKEFKCNLNIKHHYFLKTCEIYNRGFEQSIKESNENDWIFLDPPYLDRNSNYGNSHDIDLHTGLRNLLKETKSKWLLIHIDCKEYRELYKDFDINEKEFTYSQNFKGRDNSNSKINHLYITDKEKDPYKNLISY